MKPIPVISLIVIAVFSATNAQSSESSSRLSETESSPYVSVAMPSRKPGHRLQLPGRHGRLRNLKRPNPLLVRYQRKNWRPKLATSLRRNGAFDDYGDILYRGNQPHQRTPYGVDRRGYQRFIRNNQRQRTRHGGRYSDYRNPQGLAPYEQYNPDLPLYDEDQDPYFNDDFGHQYGEGDFNDRPGRHGLGRGPNRPRGPGRYGRPDGPGRPDFQRPGKYNNHYRPDFERKKKRQKFRKEPEEDFDRANLTPDEIALHEYEGGTYDPGFAGDFGGALESDIPPSQEPPPPPGFEGFQHHPDYSKLNFDAFQDDTYNDHRGPPQPSADLGNRPPYGKRPSQNFHRDNQFRHKPQRNPYGDPYEQYGDDDDGFPKLNDDYDEEPDSNSRPYYEAGLVNYRKPIGHPDKDLDDHEPFSQEYDKPSQTPEYNYHGYKSKRKPYSSDEEFGDHGYRDDRKPQSPTFPDYELPPPEVDAPELLVPVDPGAKFNENSFSPPKGFDQEVLKPVYQPRPNGKYRPVKPQKLTQFNNSHRDFHRSPQEHSQKTPIYNEEAPSQSFYNSPDGFVDNDNPFHQDDDSQHFSLKPKFVSPKRETLPAVPKSLTGVPPDKNKQATMSDHERYIDTGFIHNTHSTFTNQVLTEFIPSSYDEDSFKRRNDDFPDFTNDDDELIHRPMMNWGVYRKPLGKIVYTNVDPHEPLKGH